MSTAARIEELRKKFDENPRRYFAPLANELRKAGDLTQAIALCREHLPKQPGHMSGYIVFGQALYESDALDDARSVFEQALALDPENLIALRHLGDIARRQGDPLSARRWYERVLDADPRNDDIAAQLAALATPAFPMRSIPTPGVAMPVIQAALPDMRPVSFTPSVPVPMIGMVVPTPDAALRAIDFDEVNARLRTPLVPSISQRTPATPVPVVTAPTGAAPAPTHDLLDLDAMEVAGDDLLRTVTPAASTDTEDDSDPFAFAGEINRGDVATESVVDGSADADAALDEMSFEEGLAAPDWPDTSELVARVVTPRSVTPPFVDIPVEAVHAFGREASDPVELSLPEPEPDIADEDLTTVVLGGDERLTDGLVEPVVNAEISGVHAAIADIETDIDADLDFGADAGSDADLPWLLPAETPADDVVEPVDAAVLEHEEALLSEVVPEALPQTVSEALPEALTDFETYGDYSGEGIALEEGFEPEEEEEVPSQAFVTETMGELLVTQGFIERAISVYEELVRRRPYDPMLSSRLMELREQVQVPTPPAVATDVAIAPPVMAATAVFTARERFAALAARRVPRRTPRASVAVSAPDDGLASLFGSSTSQSDDVAARALADAFSPHPIEDATDTDSFFAASDVSSGTPARGTPARGTPAYGAVAEGAVAHGSDTQDAASTESASGAFSFDRFFPDPATQQAAADAAPERSAAPSAATDDLAQFSAWLKGLGNA